MGDWLLNLPVLWMAVVVFAATYLLAASVYWVVTRLAVNERARAFKAVSPGMLPPLGILFALLVGFIAVEVWNNYDKAKVAVASEVGMVKCAGILLQGLCALVAIAMVHSDNRLACAIAMTLFATGIALSLLLIAAYSRPFIGEISVRPNLLKQVITSGTTGTQP